MTDVWEQLSLDYCWSCDQEEPIPRGGAYICCRECGHVYATANDLIEAWLWVASVPARADEITACPLCTHNF